MSSAPDAAVGAATGETAAAAEERAAVLAGAACYLFWGFVPLLFQAAARAGAGPWEIVAWRVLWALPAAGALVLVTRRGGAVARVFAEPRTLGLLALSAALIGVNWSLFVWAVDQGRMLDASLGYYLTPLLNMASGLILFRERIDRIGWIAIALAVAGVAVETAAHGGLPLAALGMSASFAIYGVVRKAVAADAQTGLFVECVLLAPVAIAYGAWAQAHGVGHAFEPWAGFLLFLGGPVTVVPLATFAWAVRRMPLSTLGFLQFIAPTLQFVIGVEDGERLSPLGLSAFVFIWTGVAVYACGAWRRERRRAAYLRLVARRDTGPAIGTTSVDLLNEMYEEPRR